MGRLLEALIWVFVMGGAFFTLYTGAIGPYENAVQQAAVLLAVLPLIFLLQPSGARLQGRWVVARGLLFAIATAVAMGWALIHHTHLFSDPFLTNADTTFGIITLVVVLEAVRRTVGFPVTLILILFVLYALFGNHVPFAVLRQGGMSFKEMVSNLIFSTDGVFGAPLEIASTLIITIMFFGALLNNTGGAELFMNVAKAIAGRFSGGPAKIAVMSSALFGMISGSTAANAATCGSVTIPMMKRFGYEPQVAGAIEALASCGGQLMPPIMGAAAFLMVDYVNLPYLQICVHAIIPAALFFFSVMIGIHFYSLKHHIEPIPKSEIPKLRDELQARGHMIIPIIALIVLMALHLGPMYAAFLSVVVGAATSMLRRETRLTPRRFLNVCRDTIVGIAPVIAICAGAGLLIGVLTTTGLNLKITFLIDSAGHGSLIITLIMTMIACLILGMGLPTVAAYLVLATLVPPALVKLGMPLLTAHFFIFYFAVLSAITPPVAIAAYITGGIAKADPMKTGVTAVMMGLVVFLLPFMFAYSPTLLMVGDPGKIVFDTATAAIGIVFWGIALTGYMSRPVGYAARGLLAVASGLLILPALWPSIAGFVLGSATVITMRAVPTHSLPAKARGSLERGEND